MRAITMAPIRSRSRAGRDAIREQPDYEAVGGIFEYACHEGNTAVDWGLRGERHYEKMVEEAIAKGLPVPPRQPREMTVYGAPNPNAEVRDVNRSN
jgi:hypothetical protein